MFGWVHDFIDGWKEASSMTSQELQEKWEREIPGAKERFAAAARKREAEKSPPVARRPGYVDPTVSQDVSNPAVYGQKMYQAGAMSASDARRVGANIPSGVRDRRD